MLTIFSIPRVFRGHFKVIQNNAIRSWVSLRPRCEVILLGDDEGTAEIASELEIRHIPDIECNEKGVPLVNSMFSVAQNAAKHQLMCFVNIDVLLMSDFLPAVQQIHKHPFLMVGQRWDLELNEPVDFNDIQWETRLRARVAEYGKLHPASGVSYFVFPRGLFGDIPPFAIGRTGEDNWMVYKACSLKVPVVDATKAVMAIHQNHDYSHHPEGAAGVWEGPERKRNIELMGGMDHSFSLDYATWIITPLGMRRALTMRHLYFRIRALTVCNSCFHFLLPLFKLFERCVIILRSKRT